MNTPIGIWRKHQTLHQFLGKQGTLLLWTKIYVAPTGFEHQTPYLVGLVDFGNDQKHLLEIVDVSEEELHARNRLLYGESQSNPASQFLKDLPQEVLHIEESPSSSSLWESSQFFRKTSSFGQVHRSLLHPEPAEQSFAPDGAEGERSETGEPRLVREEVIFSDETPLQQGDRVSHQKFGEGWVMALQGGVVTVKFDSIRYGTKKLALSVAPLRRI
jgi:hypothetical protein